jgi:TonB family protein
MAARLGIARHVAIVESAIVQVPAVVGWLRPAIVVPASAIAGLSPAQFEAILAHELAHVRRADYLVNGLQCVVETLLFYHPAVWWISRQIRIEREHCCDDVAAELCADRLGYARALVSLEELRAAPSSLVVAATGGDLLHRVRRLVDPDRTATPRWSGGVCMTLILTAALVIVSGASGQLQGTPASEPTAPRQTQVADAPPQTVRTTSATTARARTEAGPSGAAARARSKDAASGVQATTTRDPKRPAISGTILDAHNGVIPGASVSLTRSGSREVVATMMTGSDGGFAFDGVPSGSYELTVTRMGFRTSRLSLNLREGQSAVTVIRLEVGSLSETVTIYADRPPTAGTQTSPTPGTWPRTAADYFDAAKMYFQQGRLAEAEAMTTRALELVRAAIPAATTAAISTSGPTATTGPLRVGGAIREPRRIHYVDPVYPPIARAAAVSGTVIIDATLAADGTVRDARVLRSQPLLDQAALDAVRAWQYSPTLLNGRPVEVVMTVTVTFSAR